MAEQTRPTVMAGERKYVPVEVVDRAFAMLDEMRDARDFEAERADRAEEVQRYWIDQFEKLEEAVEDGRLLGPAAVWTRIALGMAGSGVIFYLLGVMVGRGAP